ncbi:LysR family transcriptional regulator [Cupriavidus metallidurans]|uniref:Transcriptional regulator, LysR family n=1 Tax=Cupriavidus metallidurans (strain ATCC 43123 / DSM 2839 / NBRC 102507 / CH34) TaxID=266264 RepID=Q1LGR3_CUPMC|nr:LysR substrate-binding domain-containing protein [Cupriavidus metallidurans]ABF10663.1 transcriptional regulator, LysR family [Cupriavidus metallidurans CH34]QGS31869.1 LysR family transcriptional regulator [Cupriavidus metallidurans]
MDLRQLRYFVALAEELHFGRAAARLAITQPPLSFNIAKLEASLGVQLLQRTTREVALTAAGKEIYKEALKILALTANARELAGRAARGEIGAVHVGFVGSAVLTPLGERIRAFGAIHPDVDVVLHELNSFEQIDALQARHIDIGIIHPRVIPNGIASHSLHGEHFICLLPADHPLARDRTIDVRELRHDDFVLFPRHFSPEFHDQIVALCASVGFTPNIRHQVRHMLTIATLVAKRFGVSIVPRSVDVVTLPNLACRPLGKQATPSELVGIWRDDEQGSAVLSMLHALGAPVQQRELANSPRLA